MNEDDTVLALKKRIAQKSGVFVLSYERVLESKVPVEQQSLRLDPKGKSLKDEQKLKELNLPQTNAQLYLKNLGPQIPWKTV